MHHHLDRPVSSLALAAFAGAILLALGLILLAGPETARAIAAEDHGLETLQALFYAAATVISLLAWRRGKAGWVGLAWAGLCFVMLGEETSWFQRVFDYSVPAVEEISSQGEFNLHNLIVFDGGRWLNGTNHLSLSLAALMNLQNLFRLGFFCFFLVLPLAMLVPSLRNRLQQYGYVALPARVLEVVWLLIAITAVFTLSSVEPTRFYVSEVRESVYAATFFLYAVAIATITPAGDDVLQKGHSQNFS